MIQISRKQMVECGVPKGFEVYEWHPCKAYVWIHKKHNYSATIRYGLRR